VPNALSAARLLGVPVFFWLILQQHDGWALGLLIAAGISDYLDGKIARAFHLESRLGALLDPIADRLYIACAVVALAFRELIPWWLVIGLFARDVLLAAVQARLRAAKQDLIPVNFLGKAATFNLLYAFPLVLLGDGTGPAATAARAIGWGFIWWGIGMYYISAFNYCRQARTVLRHRGA
jgi:cardiolipin synthase (CMP-forming)